MQRQLPPIPHEQNAVPPVPRTLPPPVPEETNVDDAPPIPDYVPGLPEKELRIAQGRLEEFMRNGKTLSDDMEKAVPRLKMLQKNKNFPMSFFLLDKNEQTLWLNFFEKTIQYCEAIQQISNPFPQTASIISKKNLSCTSQTYKQIYIDAIDCIYKEAFDPDHHSLFKQRAICCIWFALYHTPLTEGKLKITECDNLLNPLLVVPAQRLARLALFSHDGNKDCSKLFNSGIINMPDELKKISQQFETLIARSVLIGKTVQVLLVEIKKLDEIIEKEKFYEFLIMKDKNIQSYIEIIVSVILDDKENAEKFLEDYIQGSFASWLNETFNHYLENLVYTNFIALLSQTQSNRKDTIKELKNAFTHAHKHNVTDLKKVEDMLTIAAGKISLISSNLKPEGNIFQPKKSKLLDDLEKGAKLAQIVCDHLSKWVNRQRLTF